MAEQGLRGRSLGRGRREDGVGLTPCAASCRPLGSAPGVAGLHSRPAVAAHSGLPPHAVLPVPLQDRMIHFSGCALNEACTIVLRGASESARVPCCLAAALAPKPAPSLAGRLQYRECLGPPLLRSPPAPVPGRLSVEAAPTCPQRRVPFPPAGHHVLDEADRSLHDALCVLSQTVQDSRVIYGGGWAEMQVGRERGRCA